jgi:two-component system, sensor histidine kinase PdtaS
VRIEVNMSITRELCEKYTKLANEDIDKIEHVAETLQVVADLVQADIFIDCLTRDSNTAVVVAEAKPNGVRSMYEGTVIGQLALRKNEPAVIRTLELGISTRDIKAVTQESINVKQTVEPIKNNNDKTIGVLIIEKDITKNINNKKRIEMLAETNEYLTNELYDRQSSKKDITNHIDDGIIIFDKNGVVRFTNPVANEFYQKLGYKENLVGMDFDNITLDNEPFKDIMEQKMFETFECEVGNLSLQIKYIVQNSDVLTLAMIIKDVTDFRKKEKELILKSVAIKEIHHRVKNNLQTIASLLRLQARRIKSDELKGALNESMNRILSIATTHEILAQQGIDEVDIKEVITKIKNSMIRYFDSAGKDIKAEVIGDSFTIESDKATSIALIINELLQNSLKYAFNNKEVGTIRISICKGIVYSRISVIDDGVGFDVDSIANNSLGINIVKRLVNDKLCGNFNIQSTSDGTTVLFDFKN